MNCHQMMSTIPPSVIADSYSVFLVVHGVCLINTIAKQRISKSHDMLLMVCYFNALIRNAANLGDAFDTAMVRS
jgi:hypothetical protein